MAKVNAIAISKNSKERMISVNKVKIIAGKGIIDDRYFKENNHKKSQITLIEIENINYYNEKFGTTIQPSDFRRNIITEGIELNELVGSEFFIGNIKIKAHDLCRPCKSLEDCLKQKDLVKTMLRKSGIRCEILTSGKIFVGNEIKKTL
jgi:MOSC domain-containing protein YiiM